MLLVIALAVVVGCETTPEVSTETKAGADFSRYRTFALLPLPQPPVTADAGARLRLAEPARQAVVAALAAKGYTEAPRESAYLSVNVRGQSLPKVEVTDWGLHQVVYTRAGPVNVVRNPGTTVSSYQERTLSIELYDNASKDLVWVGWASQRGQGQVEVEVLTNAIHQVLLKLPASRGGAK